MPPLIPASLKRLNRGARGSMMEMVVPTPGFGVGFDRAIMLLNDAVTHTHAKSCADAGWFRRVERFEHATAHFRGHTDATVRCVDNDAVTLTRGTEQQSRIGFRFHRMFGVDDHVQQHLLQFLPVALHVRIARDRATA